MNGNGNTQVWRDLIAIIVPSIAAITAAILAWRGSVKVVQTAVAAKELADDNAVKAMEVADKTHALVNSNMQIQLEDYLSLAKRLAEKTHDQIDMQEVERARKRLEEHIAKQKIVDIEI